MHGISSVAGARTFQWDAGFRVFTLSPPRLWDFAEKEAYILLRRPAIIGSSKTAYHVGVDEEAAFDQSTRGILFRLWQSIRNHHTEYQVDDAEEALRVMADVIEQAVESRGKLAFADLLRILFKAEEKDILGNSAGPDENGPETLAESTMPKTESPGPASTADSPKSSTGRSSKSAS
jgi:hypothetical protein